MIAQDNQPVITVALPMYRAKNIGWLALEGLSRQVCPYPWELIMIEENHPDNPEHMPMDEAERLSFNDRLALAGCVRIVHVGIIEWMPLSMKWRDIARRSSPTSKTFILHAADCYSEPHRLKRSHEAILKGADWTHSLKGVFLDLGRNTRATYHHPPAYPTALSMALRTRHARGLPAQVVSKGVDRWIFQCAQLSKGGPLKVVPDTTDGWKGSLDTHGQNNISKWRGKRIAEGKSHFKAFFGRIEEVVPGEVWNRLHDMMQAMAQ